MSDTLPMWRVKLGAWLHDPFEKALVLMRDPGVRHDQGTVATVREETLRPPLGAAERDLIHRADTWAAAGDRPQSGSKVAVHFATSPELVHPLAGERYDLGPLPEIGVEQIKAVSLAHYRSLYHDDARQTALALWRFGPDSPAPELNNFWGLLPADTRVPDHTIFDHLGLVSAFAGAFAADANGECALLAVTLGPVQDFIAVARKASDLWAGSHLLSRLAWEAMRVVGERFGPDSILFPQLRGVALVDSWLQRECGIRAELFEREAWRNRGCDANPLFAASLPNKFVALVPADRASETAAAIEAAVRGFALEQAEEAARRLAGAGGASAEALLASCREQLAGFPEVHWAAVPWALATGGAGDRHLREVGQPFGACARFLDSHAWKLLQKEIVVEGSRFFAPNPGTLYPALYDLLDRLLAAAKSLRRFEALTQSEPRCKRCGERTALGGTDFWARVGAARPSWSKSKELLCAVCALKRMWPVLFTEWARRASGLGHLDTYNVSTHTMALATTFGRLLESRPDPAGLAPLAAALERGHFERVALPRKLLGASGDLETLFRLLPAALDAGDEAEEESKEREDIRAQFRSLAGGGNSPENYYALVRLDGDGMGKWLSGEDTTLAFGDAWHSRAREIADGHSELREYLRSPRPVSPGRHIAISEALHAFSQVLAPHVVEQVYKGKLIYAGGDDVLAMVSVDDLLGCLRELRAVYRGEPCSLPRSDRGFAVLGGRLYQVMGRRATVSAGAVIAHFSSPLSRVLRELRAAESDAKHYPGKDAVSIRLLKRSGGATRLTLPNSEIGALEKLVATFADPDLSRRAAYHITSQLPLLPQPPEAALLGAVLAYQFGRQGRQRHRQAGLELAEAVPFERLDKAITVAEFLAREGRGRPALTARPGA